MPVPFNAVRLARFLATWTDGVKRVIHARDREDARDLAQRLSAVPLRSCLALDFAPSTAGRSENGRRNSAATDSPAVGGAMCPSDFHGGEQ